MQALQVVTYWYDGENLEEIVIHMDLELLFCSHVWEPYCIMFPIKQVRDTGGNTVGPVKTWCNDVHERVICGIGKGR